MATSAPRGTLPLGGMKQQLSIAYIRSVASTAGLVIGDYEEDYDGIDLTVRSFADFGICRGSSLDVQLKCTSQSDVLTSTHAVWDLHEHGYRKLQESDRLTIGVLAVLVIPESFDDWIHQDEDRLLSRGCMYFSLSKDWEPFKDGQATQRVKCARSNVLDVDNLLDLMNLAAQAKVGAL